MGKLAFAPGPVKRLMQRVRTAGKSLERVRAPLRQAAAL